MRFLVKKEKIERFERRRRRKIAKNERKTYLQSDLSAAGAKKWPQKSPATLKVQLIPFPRESFFRPKKTFSFRSLVLHSQKELDNKFGHFWYLNILKRSFLVIFRVFETIWEVIWYLRETQFFAILKYLLKNASGGSFYTVDEWFATGIEHRKHAGCQKWLFWAMFRMSKHIEIILRFKKTIILYLGTLQTSREGSELD